MDIVYTLGKGSKLKNFEIRMSLRSVEKYLQNYGKVWIVGELPDFLQNVNHIPATDNHQVPDRNIMEKITAACDHPEVSADFLFMNDDHFLLDYFDADNFPYFYEGELDTYVKKRGLDGYGKRARNTLYTLQKQNLPFKYFDVHTPITYNKDFFKLQVTTQNWVGDGHLIKSLYANAIETNGQEMKDNKINHPPTEKDRIFSTFPQIKASITRFLTEHFPEKSKFEI